MSYFSIFNQHYVIVLANIMQRSYFVDEKVSTQQQQHIGQQQQVDRLSQHYPESEYY